MAQYNGRLLIKVKSDDIWDKLNDINLSKYGISENIKDFVSADSNAL